MTSADMLVVGQGVAGSVLAWTLDQLGYRVILADAPGLPSASRAAAGIVNPLTGRKLVRTWRADALFPFLHDFYTRAERQLQTRFFYPRSIYRPYRSDVEKAAYETYTTDPEVAQYVRRAVDDQGYSPYIHNAFGGLTVTQAGWLNVPAFLDAIRAYFRAKGQFVEALVVPETIRFGPDSAVWEGYSVRNVLFSEGPQSARNPLFDWLPYNPVKGQILTAVVDDYPIEAIVNQGVFILPLDAHTIRIGATYTWHDLDWQTTDDGRVFLQNKVRELLKIPYRIVEQQAGIRPATKDRRPFVGWHPEVPTAGIFSGMGSKGVSLAPYLARQLAGHLMNGEELDPEVNISRVVSLYFRN
ncbi:MAG: FAD-binding oxidoreductase [Bacteroidetes bacterium]|nr:FAD-binding oxidoreductase [Fibrella sp.]